jgi:hypothetical protein
MTSSKLAITLSEWVFKEIIGENTKNRSAKIEEYIIKGYMAEKFEKKSEVSQKENAQSEIFTRDLIYSERFPKYSI